MSKFYHNNSLRSWPLEIFFLFCKFTCLYIRDMESFPLHFFFFLNQNTSVFLFSTLCPVLEFRINFELSDVSNYYIASCYSS